MLLPSELAVIKNRGRLTAEDIDTLAVRALAEACYAWAMHKTREDDAISADLDLYQKHMQAAMDLTLVAHRLRTTPTSTAPTNTPSP